MPIIKRLSLVWNKVITLSGVCVQDSCLCSVFARWKSFHVRYGRYLDPFSISIDFKRSRKSQYGSFLAINDIRLINCEPGKLILFLFLLTMSETRIFRTETRPRREVSTSREIENETRREISQWPQGSQIKEQICRGAGEREKRRERERLVCRQTNKQTEFW